MIRMLVAMMGMTVMTRRIMIHASDVLFIVLLLCLLYCCKSTFVQGVVGGMLVRRGGP